MEPSITDIILKHLEELGEQDFKRFREKLREHKVHGSNIPWSALEKADYYDTVNKIVECFKDDAVDESVKILDHIGNRNVAQKLRAEHKAYGSMIQGRRDDALRRYKDKIKQKFEKVKDHNSDWTEYKLLDEEYTQLRIQTKGCTRSIRPKLVRQKTVDNDSNLKDLVAPERNKNLVLKGSAGMGKSYTVRKVMLEWASNTAYCMFNYAFYLDCKNLMNIEEGISLDKLLFQDCEDLMNEEIEKVPENVLILIDGFDALTFTSDSCQIKTTQRSKSPSLHILQLFQRKELRGCYLIITIRSAIADQIPDQENIDQWAEILGFPEESIEEYFHKNFDEPEQATAVVEQVKANKKLLAMCETPLTCWVVCALSKSCEVTSDSLTHIFVNYIYSLLKYHNSTLDKAEAKTILMILCEMSKEGVENNKWDFDNEQLLNKFQNLTFPTNFLNKESYQYGVSKKVKYSFVHRSVQEVLAAVFIANNKVLCRDFLNKSLSSPHQRDTIIYLFGLCKGDTLEPFQNFNLQCFTELKSQLCSWIKEAVKYFKKRPRDSHLLQDIMFCLYELNDNELTKSTMGLLEMVEMYDIPLNKRDFLVLNYCLQNAKSLKKLILANCNMRRNDVETLLPHLRNVQQFTIEICELSKESVKLLSHEITRNCQPMKLVLSQTPVSDGLILKCSSSEEDMKSIFIQNVPESIVFLRWFLHDCKCSPNQLYFHKLHDTVVVEMCTILKEVQCQLEVLSLKHNVITEQCVTALLDLAGTMVTLVDLDLEDCEMGDNLASQLCDGLKTTKIHTLGLIENALSDMCIPAICSLIEKGTLSTLHLYSNKFSDEGVQKLFQSKKSPSSRLKDLGLDNCDRSSQSFNLKSALSRVTLASRFLRALRSPKH
ncbi:NLRP3 protein, partial [Polypterus senegalus]|nr:NACHT, LRR and PYD domains-containing protein 3-like [Polypterus senegalus]XP_039632209.1 NACHT, LRR and PYD domains-containing protein 3-like [Polypterus senegalus]XP_039632210.1 NACHT, LRR and PYD domains-containing protein 3-like [Polypterus senegalus]XP_039632211.1 NACHT, LRR and PYD domains-containing protein 3-like [Polypterus senegalus]XP_039632212.1 NACHT, LRR and PYD domains-containing protein 3-like [Polypterus senegalus]XP_039632213.1 NACHT, LRR and PYD domains-containing protein